MPDVQPTNNPVPSDHPADARDNFKILDEFVNSRGILTSPSRTGRQILTLTRYNELVQPNIDGAEAAAVSAAASAAAAEAAVSGLDYQGLWPDSGGSANKGDTYQTQVVGTGTGHYFTALQDTVIDPIGDDVNWREIVSVENVNSGDSQIAGGRIWPSSSNSYAEDITSGLIDVDVLRSSTTGRLHKIVGSPVSGNIDSFSPLDGEVVINGVTHETYVPGVSSFNLSEFSSAGAIIKMQKGAPRVSIYVDNISSVESEPVSFSGDIDFFGVGSIRMAVGLSQFIAHESGKFISSRLVNFESLDVTSTVNRIFINGRDVSKYDISSKIIRCKIVARQDNTPIGGSFKFNGTMEGNYTLIPTGVDDAVIDVRFFHTVDFSGMTNTSVGCERLIKTDNNRSFIMKYYNLGGSVKRQVVDGFINTERMIVSHGDFGMASYDTFIENKLNEVGGEYPAQSDFEFKNNRIRVGGDAGRRLMLIQCPGGTVEEPSAYQVNVTIENNLISGRHQERIFDIRGVNVYKESNNKYRNQSANNGSVILTAVEVVNIKEINADRYDVQINMNGDSVSGVLYSRSLISLSVEGLEARDFNGSGCIYINENDAVEKVTISDSDIRNLGSSTSAIAPIYLRNSLISKLNIHDTSTNVSVGSEGVVSSASTVSSDSSHDNSWMERKISVGALTVLAGGSEIVSIPIEPEIPTSAMFTGSHSRDIGQCTLQAYKNGNNVDVRISNNTDSDINIVSGDVFYTVKYI